MRPCPTPSPTIAKPARAALFAVSLLLVSATTAPMARADGFAGLWRGSGFVNPAEGRREKVRCRVVYKANGGGRYGVTARCATQSANIDQIGEVRRTGRDSYVGNFYNAEYNLRGLIRVRVSGNRQSVSLSSDGGSGQLTLFKR